MKTLISTQGKTNYAKRAAVYFLVYTPIIVLAFWLSYEIRFISDIKNIIENINSNKENLRHTYLEIQRPQALLWIIPLKFILLGFGSHYRSVIRYFRVQDALQLIYSLTLASLIIFLIPTIYSSLYSHPESGLNSYIIPRSIILVDYNLSVLLLLGTRVVIRLVNEKRKKSLPPEKKTKKVTIIGAGILGEQILIDLLKRKEEGVLPLCFLDDNKEKHGLDIHGVPVLGYPNLLTELKERAQLDEIILTLPTSAGKRIKEINEMAQKVGIKTLTIPSVIDITSGRVTITDLRPVSLEDLLGRAPANLDAEAIADLIKNQTVLVTGAGGSIGSEIARQVAQRNPKQLIILDQCEVLLYAIEQELISRGYGEKIYPVVADIIDSQRMEEVFKKFKPDLVLHAAAHKHVPMMESQPGEALKNNTQGTTQVA
jgi:FlaA1/EpsC-like NDP-sugar epimerase